MLKNPVEQSFFKTDVMAARTAWRLRQLYRLTYSFTGHVVQNGEADSSEIKKLNELHSHAIDLAIKNPQLDSSIHVANQKITEYKRRYPQVKMK